MEKGRENQIFPVVAKQLHHFSHSGNPMFGERARDNRLDGVRQTKVKAPGICYLHIYIVSRKCRGQIGDIIQAISQANVFDKIGRPRRTDLICTMIEDIQSTGTGNEVYVVPPLSRACSCPLRSNRVNELGASAIA